MLVAHAPQLLLTQILLENAGVWQKIFLKRQEKKPLNSISNLSRVYNNVFYFYFYLSHANNCTSIIVSPNFAKKRKGKKFARHSQFYYAT